MREIDAGAFSQHRNDFAKECLVIVSQNGRLIANGTAADLRREANATEADLEQVFLNLTADGPPSES